MRPWGVRPDRTRRGVCQDAIAALVLLATRYPAAQTQPWESGRYPAAAGIMQGGMGDEATSHHWGAGCSGSVAGGGARCHRRGGPGAGKESHSVDDEFVEEFLSEECGVEVTATVTGRVTIFTFPDGRVLQDLSTLNIKVVWSAGDNQILTRDVGIDQVRVQPDGTVILSIVGRVPVDFTGVLKINLETDEAILEPHHFVDLEEVCAQLTA